VPLLLSVVPSELSGEVMALQAVTFLLVIRAAIVPSLPLRTALVGFVAVAPLAIGSLAQEKGFATAFLLASGAFVLAALSWIWIPETKGRALG
jgi:hypothetical protein